MLVEEISLTSAVDEFADDEPAEEQVVVARLEQYSRLRRYRLCCTLLSDGTLSLQAQGPLQKPLDFSVAAVMLDAQPKRSFRLCWPALLAGAAAAAAAWFAALQASVWVAVLMALGSLAGLVTAVYRSHDRLVFYTRTGRAPLVVLFNRLPDKATLAAFNSVLVQKIETAGQLAPDGNDALIQELKAHRGLLEQGAISARRYEIVKQRLLSRHQ